MVFGVEESFFVQTPNSAVGDNDTVSMCYVVPEKFEIITTNPES